MTKMNNYLTQSEESGHNVPVTHEREESIILPSADIVETQEAYLLMLDMPGATKESIHVAMEKSVLHVKGTVETLLRSGGSVLFSEIQATGYSRTFNIGDGIDTNKIDATFESGVLTITLPKREEAKPREISIR